MGAAGVTRSVHWRRQRTFRLCSSGLSFPDQPRSDDQLGGQCSMEGTLVRDVHETRALSLVERSHELDVALDPVEPSDLRLAGLAVGGVDPRVPQTYPPRPARPTPAPAV